MGILTSVLDYALAKPSAQRAKDPFADRTRNIYDIANDLDFNESGSGSGFEIPQVYTAAAIYGNALSFMDFKLFRKDGEKKTEVQDHPVIELFSKNANEYTASSDFLTSMCLHWVVTGNSWAWIARDRRGNPKELIPLNPYGLIKVEVISGKKMWTWNHSVGNQPIRQIVVPDEDMFHIMMYTMDGIVGINPIEAQRSIMKSAGYLNTYVEKFFENGAHLKAVIETDKVLSDTSRNNFVNSWHSAFSGPYRVAKTAVLEDGMKYKPIQMNPKDVLFLENTGNITKTVANLYRIPLYLFNEYKEGAQYDNVEAQDLAWVKGGIGPFAKRIEQEIRRKLIPSRTSFIPQFDLFSLSRGDMKSISEYVNRFFILGALNQDEIRERYLHLNPLPDNQGSRYYVQGNNMVPIDKIDEIYESKLQGSIPGQGGNPTTEDTDLPTVKEDL